MAGGMLLLREVELVGTLGGKSSKLYLPNYWLIGGSSKKKSKSKQPAEFKFGIRRKNAFLWITHFKIIS